MNRYPNDRRVFLQQLAAMTALASTRYYEGVAAGDAEVDDYFRLFMLPGVLHCANGAGPSLVDYLTSLENWVEKGQAPDQLTAFFEIEKSNVWVSLPILRRLS